MKRAIINIVIFLLVATTAGYLVLDHPTLERQAYAAYQSGDYAKALPLFKKYAATPEVYTNPAKRNEVTLKIVEIENKLSPAATAASTDPSGADLVNQAMAYALSQKVSPSDPPMGKDRIPHTPVKKGELVEMTIKQMGNFEFDPNTDSEVPADVMLLDGAHVRLNGFMIPLTQAEKISDFALVPSLAGCCFGQPPGVQHIVTCRLPENKGVDFAIDEIVVEGILKVRVKRESGFTNSIFEMQVTGVRPKEQ